MELSAASGGAEVGAGGDISRGGVRAELAGVRSARWAAEVDRRASAPRSRSGYGSGCGNPGCERGGGADVAFEHRSAGGAGGNATAVARPADGSDADIERGVKGRVAGGGGNEDAR